MRNSVPSLKARRLEPGATIGVIVPSEPINECDFEKGVAFLRSEGFNVILGKHVRRRNGHLAGTDDERADDLNTMFLKRDVDAVFFGAGGANSARLLPLIDYGVIRANPKIVLGLSDPTSLLCGIHARTGLITFHGPVVQYNLSHPMSSYTNKYFRRALMSPEPIGPVSEVTVQNVLRAGTGRGRLIGGNLTTLQQLIGTPFEPHWDGAILFWEEVCEQPHSIDAKLTHFRNAGVLARIAGLIIGTLESCEESDYEGMPPIESIVLELAKDFAFPIIQRVDLGHTENKLTIPIGAVAELNSQGAVFAIGESGVC